MPLQAGIVGLPNVGKSTLFNALTAAGAESANYPFTTIDPNVGVVEVPDERLRSLGTIIGSPRITRATVEVVDIAGLVRGASAGEGLGNQFLDHIRSVDAVVHVLRCFEHPDVAHVEGEVDPIRDAEIVSTELTLADLAVAERRLERFDRAVKTGDKTAAFHRDVCHKLVSVLDEGRPARAEAWLPEEMASLLEAQLLTLKKVLYVCNVDEDGLGGNPWTSAVGELAAREGAGTLILNAAVEAEIAELDSADRPEFLQALGLKEPGLNRLVGAVHELLGLRTFFTAGTKEARARPVPAGTLARQAAGEIHTDFERGFIKAEVYPVEKLVEHGSEAALRAAGLIRTEGRDYEVRDGDVILFRFNV